MRPEEASGDRPERGRGAGLTDEERRVLGELTGSERKERVTGAAEPRGVVWPKEEKTGRPETGRLTAEELEVRRAAMGESQRIVQEDLPRMFPEGRGSLVAKVAARRREPRRGGAEAAGHGGEAKVERRNLLVELLNQPERWLGPAALSGVGLAGILLLLALLIVILIEGFLH